jgi:hypothetical protein
MQIHAACAAHWYLNIAVAVRATVQMEVGKETRERFLVVRL